MDNGTEFRSGALEKFIRRYLRAACRPSENEPVKRRHRVIKAIGDNGKISSIKVVFRYNMSPRSGGVAGRRTDAVKSSV